MHVLEEGRGTDKRLVYSTVQYCNWLRDELPVESAQRLSVDKQLATTSANFLFSKKALNEFDHYQGYSTSVKEKEIFFQICIRSKTKSYIPKISDQDKQSIMAYSLDVEASFVSFGTSLS